MKIDLDWIKKELDAGREVKLEGINVCYISEDNHVLSVDGDDLVVSLGAGKMWIPSDNFKHFRIKRPTPTFDDLIDVATRAAKDGLLEINKLNKDFITATLPGNHDFSFLTSYRSKPQNFEKDILSINSLYTETFVIESEGDISRVKSGADIELANGNKCTFLNNYGMWRIKRIKDDKGFIHNCGLLVLKGATVTQKRGK